MVPVNTTEPNLLFTVLAARPTAGSAFAFEHIFFDASDMIGARFVLFDRNGPTDEFVAREG